MKARIFLTISGLILTSQLSFAQCSMCRAVVETDISGKGSGINNGIVYLMVFPYALIVVIAIAMIYKMKRDRNSQIN